MTILDWIAEHRIVDAQRIVAFDGMAGRGQTLDLDDDTAVPPESRAAFRLLKNVGLAPDWIAIGREIDVARSRLQAELTVGKEAGTGLRAKVAALNRRIGDFNLQVPHADLQKPRFRV